MATTLSQEWLPNLRFIVKYSENQPILAIFALPRVANISLGEAYICGGENRGLFFIFFPLFSQSF